VLTLNEPGAHVTVRSTAQEQECLGCATTRDVVLIEASKHAGALLAVCGQCLVSALAVRLAAVSEGAE
jgi:hypothetical protein